MDWVHLSERAAAIRDLLRKRMRLVQHWTAHVLSVQIIITRNTGSCLSCSKIEELTREEMEKLLADEVVRMAARASMEVIKRRDEQIGLTEKMVKEKAKLRDEFKLLKTVWGVGRSWHWRYCTRQERSGGLGR